MCACVCAVRVRVCVEVGGGGRVVGVGVQGDVLRVGNTDPGSLGPCISEW